MTLFAADSNSGVVQVASLFGVEDICQVTLASGGFSGAAIYRVECSAGRVFAGRRTPLKSSLPVARVRSLHSTLRRIQDGGLEIVPVPLSIRKVDEDPGTGLLHGLGDYQRVFLPDSWFQVGTDVWQFEPWMPGAPASADPPDSMVRSAVQTLHEFHVVAKAHWQSDTTNEWFFCRTGHSSGIQRRLRIASDLAGGMLRQYQSKLEIEPSPEIRQHGLRVCRALDRWLPWLVARLQAVAAEAFVLQPVIRDLWRPHVLFTDDAVSGLIDLSAMASDHVCFDVTRLFRSWFGANAKRVHESMQLFADMHPLNSAEKGLAQTLDAATVLLSPVTWLQRRLGQNEGVVWSEEMTRRLAELAETAEHFEPLKASNG